MTYLILIPVAILLLWLDHILWIGEDDRRRGMTTAQEISLGVRDLFTKFTR